MLLKADDLKIKVRICKAERPHTIVFEDTVTYTNPIAIDVPALPIGDYTIQFLPADLPDAHLVVKEHD